MAAYIDLNPVRAGLVADPKDYRWSGYGEAVAGRQTSRLGYQTVMGAVQGPGLDLIASLAAYRVWLYGQGAVEGVNGPGEPTVRPGIGLEQVQAVLAAKGKLRLEEYVRCRVRYFVDGVVIGSRAFVDGVFEANRTRFGARRKDGARRLARLADNSLFSLRDLKLNPLG
jgi:putative transposase